VARAVSSPIRVAIVDDHPVVREGTAAIVARQEDMQVVASAASVQELTDAQTDADVVLLDLRLGNEFGFGLLQQTDQQAAVVVLTAKMLTDEERALLAERTTAVRARGATDRREFLTGCACLIAGGLVSACASLATRPVPVTEGRVRLPLAKHPELTRPGGALKILPEGATNPLYVLRLDGDRFAVLSPICTHQGCTVDIQGPRLVCPCHGSTYDREGRVLRGPAERALARLGANLSDGVLVIEVASRG
jgi:nitrite reductase/ring-hydroxylating ferredoxin subunit/CheY-like chemotaxis protein